MRLILTLLVLLCCSWAEAAPITLHVVPHTHCDIGWLETLEQYYKYNVSVILNGVVQALQKNPQRTFTWVETAFLQRWWTDATPSQRDVWKKLVQQGRIEHVGGGWCMNDEGVTDWEPIINQMTLGHQWLKTNVGAYPEIGWQIDPFGSVASIPMFFSKMCFKNHVYARVDIDTMQQLQQSKSMEFYWQDDTDAANPSNDMLTHIMYGGTYCTPEGFDWEDDSKKNPAITPSNAAERAKAFAELVHQRADNYATNQILWPFGCDFKFQRAEWMFSNMEKLAAAVNADISLGIHVQFSTPSQYFASLRKAASSLPSRKGDFMPYCSYENGCWTGYFTTRPALKGFTRSRDAVFDAAEMLASSSSLDSLQILRRAQADMTHHDAVTGTSKERVNTDWFLRLEEGTMAAEKVVLEELPKLWAHNNASCPVVGTSTQSQVVQEALQLGTTAMITLLQSISWEEQRVVRLTLVGTPPPHGVVVTDIKGTVIVSQIVTRNATTYDVFFSAKIPAMGYSTVFVKAATAQHPMGWITPVRQAEEPVISNEVMDVGVDTSGRLSWMRLARDNVKRPIVMSLKYYSSTTDGNYVFQPSWPNDYATPKDVEADATYPQVQVVHGPVVEEITLILRGAPHHFAITMRLVKNGGSVGRMLEIESNLGELPPEYEVIVEVETSSLESKGAFEYDRSGWILGTHTWDSTSPTAKNFFPMIRRMGMEGKWGEDTMRLAILTERAHGCTSRGNGQAEVLVHRRCTQDDHHGMGETLNDTSRVQSKLWLMLDSVEQSQDEASRAMLVNRPVQFVFSVPQHDVSACHLEWSRLQAPLPSPVHLSAFHRLDTHGNVLVRLAHLYPLSAQSPWNAVVSLNMTSMFGNVFSSIEEQSLSGARPVNCSYSDPREVDTVTMHPLDIRTFIGVLKEY